MASCSHNLSDYSCQEELNEISQGNTNSVCPTLSKSSLIRAYSSPRGPQQKPEIHKSLNSIICAHKCNENSIQHSHTSEWSPTHDAVPDLCRVKSDCNHLSVSHVQDKIPSRNLYRSADSSLATAVGQEVPSNFVRYEVSENVSCLGHSETSVCQSEIMNDLEKPVAFHKSYSDYFCGSRNSVSEHTQNSAIYSSLSSCSCISVSACDEICTLSNETHDSGIGHSTSNVRNNLSDVMPSVGDLCHLDSSTIQHNITIYAVPGTYQHGILGPRNSGNGFPNNEHMFSESHYSIPGIVCCNNVSDTKILPSEIISLSNCPMHCNKSHEPLMKGHDTISAYCHALPIPSLQYTSGLAKTLGEPASGHLPPQCCTLLSVSDKFTFPKLVSSVSESGLDAKKLIKCGRLAFPPPSISSGQLNIQNNSLVQENSDLLLTTMETLPDSVEITDSSAKMKDTWTMTSFNYCLKEYNVPLKDAEVQTTIIMENKAVSTSPCPQTSGHSHFFPEVGLALTLQSPQTPVREVRWDNEGMTWEVYGAAVDPEVLGLAIQKHLEIQIEQHLQPSELSVDMEQSTKDKRRSLRTVIQSLRHSNCCVSTNSTSE